MAELSPNTLRLLVEYGFAYSSNLQDSNAPYRHVVDGRPTDLVELPFSWVLNDATFFLYSLQLPGKEIASLSTVREYWLAELDGLYVEGRGNAFTLTAHPQVIGPVSRIALLERVIERAKALPHTWFGRCDHWVERIRGELDGG